MKSLKHQIDKILEHHKIELPDHQRQAIASDLSVWLEAQAISAEQAFNIDKEADEQWDVIPLHKL